MEPDEHDDYSWRIVVVTTLCLVVSTVAVGLRFYVRCVIIRKLGYDDWFLAGALVFYIGVAIMTAACKHETGSPQLILGLISNEGINFGLGRHIDTISFQKRSVFLKLIWFASIGYGAVIVLIKMAFLFQYRRVFPLRNFQRACDLFLVFVVLWAVGGTIGAILNCRPLKRNWDPLLPRDCAGRMSFWFAMGVLHVLTDVIIFILPLPLLGTLPLPRSQKVILMAIFSLGFFTCAISIIRLTTLRASTLSADPTWTMASTVTWSVSEAACAILCVCIPTLRPLLRRFHGWRLHSGNANELVILQRSEEANSRTPGSCDMDSAGTQNKSSSQTRTDVEDGFNQAVNADDLSRPRPCHLSKPGAAG